MKVVPVEEGHSIGYFVAQVAVNVSLLEKMGSF